jgi:hypothetical protein
MENTEPTLSPGEFLVGVGFCCCGPRRGLIPLRAGHPRCHQCAKLTWCFLQVLADAKRSSQPLLASVAARRSSASVESRQRT